MSSGVLTLVFDLRFSDSELFESARANFTEVLSELLSLWYTNTLILLKNNSKQHVELLATKGDTRLIPIWDSTRDHNNPADSIINLLSTTNINKTTLPNSLLTSTLTAVRSPLRETDQYVVESLLQLYYTTKEARKLIFFTSFTTINDFSRLVHTTKLLAMPLMENSWISIHLDNTALTTTTLSLTPAIRSIRCPISPLSVRSVLQQSISQSLDMYKYISVSLRFGRYSVPCSARRSFFPLPTRCCTVEDFNSTSIGLEESNNNNNNNNKSSDTASLVISGSNVCCSHFERERWAAKEVVLIAEGITNGDIIREDILYGDGWVLLPKESLTNNNSNNFINGSTSSSSSERSPEEWMHHLQKEIEGDILILTTQQPLLDPPHQLALPCSIFIAFFLESGQLYIRAVIPVELRREWTESIFTAGPTRYRHDINLSNEIKKTAETLRTKSNIIIEKKPIGICSVLAHLKSDQRFMLQLEKKSQVPVKRGTNYSLHSNYR